MIEETARVGGLEDDFAWVETQRKSTVPLVRSTRAAAPRRSLTTTEGLTILSGLGGLAGGFAWLRHYAKKIARDPRYQPVIIRRATASVSPGNTVFSLTA